MTRDFRYVKDGVEVEAYQITDESRYAQKEWPDWLDSRQFITVDGQHYFIIGGDEIPIPWLGWILKDTSDRLSLMQALDFENYAKVVPDPPDPMTVDVIADTLIHKSMLGPQDQTVSDLLLEIQVAIELMQNDNSDNALKHLIAAISKRTTWCECPPGECVGGDVWSCREKSPLVKESD